MWGNGKLVQTAIGALVGTAIVTVITGRWSYFLFSWVASVPFTRAISYILFEKKAVKREEQESERQKEAPFVVSEYFSRMEKAALDILEAQEPIDQTIILWWGLDGLRLNEDETLEWVSRKKPKPVNQDISYQMYQSAQTIQIGLQQTRWTDQTQSTRAQIEELTMRNAALQNQAAQQMRNAAIIGMLPPPMMPGYIGYSPYMQPPYMQPAFVPPLQQCCVQYPSYYYGGCCRFD